MFDNQSDRLKAWDELNQLLGLFITPNIRAELSHNRLTKRGEELAIDIICSTEFGRVESFLNSTEKLEKIMLPNPELFFNLLYFAGLLRKSAPQEQLAVLSKYRESDIRIFTDDSESRQKARIRKIDHTLQKIRSFETSLPNCKIIIGSRSFQY